MEVTNKESNRRWSARSRTGFLVSVVAIIIPIALSVFVAFTLSSVLPHPTSNAWRVLWWVAVLGAAWLAALAGEVLARPLLPLASLLKLTLLFPDRAPSRFKVAWRAGSTRQLDRYVHGIDDTERREPIRAASEILALVAALSAHDRRTRGHSERVRAYTDLLADELKLSPDERDRLRWSALLHDIGKLSVHADILNKAGAPSAAEWEILRQHPLEGRRLIEPLMAWLGPWGLAVEQHHENFDGSGYPFGLAGNQISMGARIVSVADSFEVMTSMRSYKSAMAPTAAREELTRCAGTQFDPAIVRAFLNVSVGKQRWIIGPLAWLFDVPIVSQVANLGRVLVTTSQVALIAGTLAIGGLAAHGHYSLHPLHSATPASHQPAVRFDSVAARISTSTVTLGGRINVSAVVSSRASTGEMKYLVYRNATCSRADGGLVATLGPVPIVDGVVPRAATWTAVGTAGTFYIVATYSGDANNTSATSACGAHPVTVNRVVPVLALQLSSTTVSSGARVRVMVALTKTASGASGTVTYFVYRNDACSTAGGGLVTTFGPLTMSRGVVPRPPTWTALLVGGTYYIVATYSGDVNNAGASSGCSANPVTVVNILVTTTPPTTTTTGVPTVVAPPTTTTTPPTTTTTPPTTTTTGVPTVVASPTTTTTPPPTTTTTTPPTTTTSALPATITITAPPSSGTVAIGGSVTDTAVLSSATSNAGGTVTYEVFNNNTCASAGLVSTLGPVTVTGAVVPTSPSWTATVAGTFYFVAVYSGDANNTGATSGCGAQPVTVTPPAIAGTLTLANTSGKAGEIETGDTIVVTFTTPPSPNLFCSSWSATSYPLLTGSNVQITAAPVTTGTTTTDEISGVIDTVDCSGGFAFGTINLGQTGYLSGPVTFTSGSISWDGVNKLTITLGGVPAEPTNTTPSVAVFTPDPRLGYVGTLSSTSGINF